MYLRPRIGAFRRRFRCLWRGHTPLEITGAHSRPCMIYKGQSYQAEVCKRCGSLFFIF